MSALSDVPDQPTADDVAQGVLPRPWNPMDSLLQQVDATIRTLGLPGFQTQTLLWLEGRADVGRLRAALERLGRRYPIVTSRLIQAGRRSPVWRACPGAAPVLHLATLESADGEAVLEQAARLLSAPHDLASDDPIRFHLWHLPDGRDVFLMQYNHLLMDNNAAVLVLRELNGVPSAESADVAIGENEDRLADYFGRFSRGRRLRAALRLADQRLRVLRFRPTILADGGSADAAAGPVRVISREIPPELTQALQARVIEICRFPGLSMALLASAFRAVGELASAQQQGRRNYVAGIGIDLGLRDATGPIFQNLVSLLPISAGQDELSDHAALVRRLNEQLRQHLQQDLDLGALELARLFRRFRRLFRRSMARLVKGNYSLWYGYFGPVDAGERFCGSEIANVRYIGPAWPPLGLTLLVNQFRGRTLFQATYLSDRIPDRLARQFLDFVVADLLALTK